MDLLNINEGKLRIDEQGQMFVNYRMTYSPSMTESNLLMIREEIRKQDEKLFSNILRLESELLQSNELINALLYILVEKSVLKDVSDVNQMVQEIRDSRKVVDVLVKAGEINNDK
jgi:hypothetical protein